MSPMPPTPPGMAVEPLPLSQPRWQEQPGIHPQTPPEPEPPQ
jgi:hypothetical protein